MKYITLQYQILMENLSFTKLKIILQQIPWKTHQRKFMVNTKS